jgi:hypothetical protein
MLRYGSLVTSGTAGGLKVASAAGRPRAESARIIVKNGIVRVWRIN